ncbi:spore germination protein [Brevibacillus choshinensis]|uniref:spore germination protein n=1 Tax=Brevibacillus choshinensis TaxID=54911 RepID=UPI002E243A24|nr:spore germination protein [Brevibacillus choshinensis]MED4779780.1 spore germination protein [Brevibacillus choshinensis]
MPDTESKVQPDIQVNLDVIKGVMNYTQDLIEKNIYIHENNYFTVLYLSGLADPSPLLKIISTNLNHVEQPDRSPIGMTQIERFVTEFSARYIDTIGQIVDDLIVGQTIFLFNGSSTAISFDTLAVNTRSIKEPENEVTIKGPHDGFNELLENNIALVRFHCPSPSLTVEYRQLGKITKNRVAILSMKGIVSEEILQEIHQRISNIPYDSVLDANYLEEWITDDRVTLFPLLESTERPDRVAGSLLEGRVAIMLNGVPMTLLAPYLFLQSFQVNEDYYWRYHIASALRLLRLFCGFVTLYLPAFFVATITYHHEFLPTRFLMSIAQGQEPVPYPTLVEILLMEVAFEILREAGLRLPRQVGSAVSIVGALVIGQAAVQAGIISPVTVILVSFTGICSFTLPSNTSAFAIRMLRFAMIITAGFLGYVGIITAGILLLVHLASLRSFGVPYLSPLAPFNLSMSTDIFIRRPLYMSKRRPSIFRVDERERFRR